MFATDTLRTGAFTGGTRAAIAVLPVRRDRHHLAVSKFGRALKKAKEELVMFFSLALIIASAAIVYGVESAAGTEGFESIFHSLWWSVATLTTVGYGDFSPETPLGKLFTGVIIFAGLGRGASFIALAIVALVVGLTLLLSYIDPLPGIRSKF